MLLLLLSLRYPSYPPVDLQAEGPVPWRMEIEEAIRSCSKFVALVDRAYLTSFNCLQVGELNASFPLQDNCHECHSHSSRPFLCQFGRYNQ